VGTLRDRVKIARFSTRRDTPNAAAGVVAAVGFAPDQIVPSSKDSLDEV
jgi:hypothetical protein